MPFKHGYTDTQTYRAWTNMLNRCRYSCVIGYENYGGRGISVCDRWQESFLNFLADMGECPSAMHSLDRINVNGNYEKSNCRWVLRQEQASNKRTNRHLAYNGKNQTISDWARETGISVPTIHYRLKRGWSVEKALTEPTQMQQRKTTRTSYSRTGKISNQQKTEIVGLRRQGLTLKAIAGKFHVTPSTVLRILALNQEIA